jgi:C4-dicarboxylate transporter/malic acid transport protein
VVGNFVPTVAIALLVLAVQFIHLANSLAVALALWSAGSLLAFGFSFLILYKQFIGEQVLLDHVTPGMFIPPVGLVVIPVAGAPLAQALGGPLQGWILTICYIGLGSGALLWLSLQAITMFRFVLHKPMPGPLVPTFWINLGPVGVMPVSLLALADATPFIADKAPFHIAALLLWGFGAWWLCMAALLTLSYWRRGQLPFALSWWAFTFPTGAFALASFRLSGVVPLPGIFALGVVTVGLLTMFWSVTLVRSARGALDGSLFQPH